MHRLLLLALLVAGCVSRGLHASSLDTDALGAFIPGQADAGRKARLLAVAPRLDAHFQTRFIEAGATGMVVGIVMDGELVYGRAFGIKDTQSKAPVDLDGVFRIASMTKSFTAAAVMRLRDEGAIELDAPAATYLPELEELRGPTRDAPPITVRRLLSNSSGLPYDDMWGAVSFGYDDRAFARFLRAGISLASAPGERYAYSNLGFALLGKIVERVSGMRFRDYVTASVLRPLGMRSTVWDDHQVKPGRLVVGYRRGKGPLIAEARPADGAFDAAGGLYTSMRDYARYVAFQLAAYPPRDEAETGPLRRSTVREMHEGQRWARWRGEDAPVVERKATGELSLSAASYGFGWLNNTTCDYEGMVQHGGFEPGYWATVHLLPRHGLGIITFAASGPVGWRAIGGTLALLREAGLLAPRWEPASPALSEARTTIDRLLETWDPALVDRTFDRQSLKFEWLETIREDFARLARDHGHCQPDGPIRPVSRLHGSWRVRCERGAIEFTAFLTPAMPPLIQSTSWREDVVATDPPGESVCKP